MIMDSMYSNERDGLCGNDDAGQMSAWYIFSAMGFYPVNPGSDEYAVGSPMVKNAKIDLGNGEKLVIQTVNQSSENVFVEKVEVNGKLLVGTKLKHSDIMQGGTITFHMQSRPNN